MINGSFVFGLDSDGPDVFARTVAWGVEHSLATATYHILTPYPSTPIFERFDHAGRILTQDWELYDTRHVVYAPKGLSGRELEAGYLWAYREFYAWKNIIKAARGHEGLRFKLKQLCYTGGWKKAEPFWKVIINSGMLEQMLPFLEFLLAEGNIMQNEEE